VENPVEKNRNEQGKPREFEHFSGLHHRGAPHTEPARMTLRDDTVKPADYTFLPCIRDSPG
jgi:hypothetical protein